MKITVAEAKDLSNNLLIKLGLAEEEAKYVTENLVEAELAGKNTHGFIRLLGFKKSFDNGKFNTQPIKLDILSETPVSLHLDGHGKLGYAPIYKSLEMAFEKIKTSRMVAVGIKDVRVTGYIGAYARKAIEKDLIFIGFNNSDGGLIPFGSTKNLWGTNPITVGVPTNDIPVILDMASSQITWGNLLVAKNENKTIKEGVAVDKDGNPTTDPNKAIEGGLLPISGHKGSGLAFIVEIIAGALTGSRCGFQVPGEWGSFYILLDPTLFRTLADFKKDIATAINELKTSPSAMGFEEIFFAGEKSGKLRQKQLDKNMVEIGNATLNHIQGFLKL